MEYHIPLMVGLLFILMFALVVGVLLALVVAAALGACLDQQMVAAWICAI